MSRSRRVLFASFLVAGLLFLGASVATVYVQRNILDADRFADHAVASVDDPAVSRLVTERVTDRVVVRAAPDLITLKPLVESAVAGLLDTGALRGALRRGAVTAHRAVFDRELETTALRIANASGLVHEALEAIDPQLAQEVPSGVDAEILRFSDQPALVRAAQASDRLERWAGLLPALTLALLGAAVLVAPSRRRGLVVVGFGMVGIAAMSVVALGVTRIAVIAHIPAGERDAGRAVWGEFLGGMTAWFLWTAAAGVFVAALAATYGRVRYARGVTAPLEDAWAWLASSFVRRRRSVWSALSMIGVGLLMILAAGFVVRLLVIAAGVYLVAAGLSAIADRVYEARGHDPEELKPEEEPVLTRRGAITACVVIVVLATLVGVGLSLSLRSGPRAVDATEAAGPGCNGFEELCGRPLDEVAFLATHNSYAGAGYPGFLFAAQEGTIGTQLADGVRGLWIDTYYGVPGRRVYTRTDLIDPSLNAQLKATIGPRAEAAAARIRDDIARPPVAATTHIYLCHGFCELGAVDAGAAFRGIRDFLERNPRQILIIDLEDYTRPSDTVALLRRSGLARYIYKGPDGPPWPTLGEMSRSGGRILLVVEHRTEGAPAWYRPAYDSILQETPFAFSRPEEMSCDANRGKPGNSLFLINNWISTDPTPRRSNAAIVNGYDFLLRRARRCERERDHFPNVLSVDFYRTGDAAAVVDDLNGVAVP